MTFNRPLGAFACLYEERTPTAPVNKQKSGWQRKLEARIKAEGRNPDSAKAQTDKILRVNKETCIGGSTVGAGDRSARIRTSGVC